MDSLEQLIARIEKADLCYWFEKIMRGLHADATESDRGTATAFIPGIISLREDLVHIDGLLYHTDDGSPGELGIALDQLVHPLKRLEQHFRDDKGFNPDVESLGYYTWKLLKESKDLVVPPKDRPSEFLFES